MKRKTKSKSRRTDILVTFLCLFLSAFFITLFYLDLTGTTNRGHENSVGTITFKHRTAQRKFEDRIVWERLPQHADLYDEDTIRTAAMSEATLKLNDGTTVKLGENSMLQIHYAKDGKVSLTIDEGDALVDSTESEGDVSVSFSDGEKAEIGSGSAVSVSAAKSGGGKSASVDVLSGSATVKTTAGETREMASGESLVVQDGEAQENPLSVILPLKNSRVIKFTDEESSIPFEWRKRSDFKNEKVTIELSSDKNFSKIDSVHSGIEGNGKSVSLPEGTFHWRAYTESTKETPAKGRIEIIKVSPPEVTLPSPSTTITRSKTDRGVAFIWTDTRFADGYKLRLSESADMKNVFAETEAEGHSAMIDGIPDGTFYYQVVPHFSIDKIGYACPSRTFSAKIETETEARPPVLVFPGHGLKITVGERKRSQVFKWETEQEDSVCKFTISKTATLSKPIFTKETAESSIEIPLDTLLKNGDDEYFWNVAEKAADGKTLKSETRRFSVRKERETEAGEVRLLYPPDGFSGEQAKIERTEFLWSASNLKEGGTVILQISKSADFSDKKNIQTEKRISENSVGGISLPTGTFFWRCGVEGGEKTEWSEIRSLTVHGRLGEVEIESPKDGEEIVVYGKTPTTIEWKKVKDADCYNVKILDESGRIVAQDPSVVTERYTMPLAQGKYTAHIQPVALPHDETTSQRTGTASKVLFSVRAPDAITLSQPLDNAVLDGLGAIRNGQTFTWKNGIDKPESAELVISKRNRNGTYSEAEKVKAGSGKAAVGRLKPGEYKWKVAASAKGGIPLDSAERHFTVAEIPELPPPVLVSPKQNFTMTADYLRKNRTIKFQWKAVEGANSYSFKFYRKLPNGKLKLVRSVANTKKREVEFSALSELDVGTFTWTVAAYSYSKDGYEEQHGKVAGGQFKIDFAIPKTATPLEPGRMYGE